LGAERESSELRRLKTMKRFSGLTAIVTAVLILSALAAPALAQVASGEGRVTIPESSKARPGDAGVRFHTNIEIFTPKSGDPSVGPPFSGYAFETPASLACVYRLTTYIPGCNPNNSSLTNPSGGSKTIAVVDAYDYPNAASDLETFSNQFGLPFSASQFQVIYASGSQPATDPTGGWELEESLDIEWAHAMAPGAMIYLVEAASNSNSDLDRAVSVASNLVRCGQTRPCSLRATGAGEITMSWGSDEYRGETSEDSYFTTPGVVYVAAAGDAPGVDYPCTSPRVVCAGGTTTARNPSTGNFLYEITWAEGSGGVSAYEPIPPYQHSNSSIRSLVGTARGVPDLSFDSNPDTGAWVYDSMEYEGEPGGWFIVGGTSLASASLAGVLNSAGSFASSSTAELQTIYGNLGNANDFNDITSGICGPYAGWTAATGWDFCTGVGSPASYAGK
jgi:subtilase family serine protease